MHSGQMIYSIALKNCPQEVAILAGKILGF